MRAFKLLAALTFIFTCSLNILASRNPVQDVVVYQGVSYRLAMYPMEYYFAAHPEKQRPPKANTTVSPNGFFATFEFVGNDLYLKDYQMIEGFGFIGKSIIWDLFPRDVKLKINWLSEPIIFGQGKSSRNENKDLIYKSYLVLNVKNGEIQSKREITHEEYQNYLKAQSPGFPVSTANFSEPTSDQQTADNKVTVFLKNGDRLSGLFISGDTKTIKMTYASAELSFNLSEVRSLTFGTNSLGVSSGVQGLSFGFTERLTNSGILNGRAINLVKPAYSPAARALNAGGTVNVQIIIDEEGKSHYGKCHC